MKRLLAISIATTLILAAAFVSMAARSNSHRTMVDPEPLENPILIQDEHGPAMIALAALYAPAHAKEDWIKMVCEGMSAGGCEYFKTNQADGLWQSQTNHDASSGGFIESVKEIDETTQVWHAKLTIFARSSEVKSDVYLLVEQGADEHWYLIRVLYGPGISANERF